jgi:predicted RNase H-like HicB family nuclease
VLIEHDEDGFYVAEVPALPGCISQGDTREEPLANIREAIALYLKSLEEHHEVGLIELGCSNRLRFIHDDPIAEKRALNEAGHRVSNMAAGSYTIWAWVDSNHRPHAYQACALTT